MKKHYFKSKHEFGTGEDGDYGDEQVSLDIQVEMWFSDKEIPEKLKKSVCENLHDVIGRALEAAVEQLMSCDNLPDVLSYLSEFEDEYPDFNDVERFGGEHEDDIVLVDI